MKKILSSALALIMLLSCLSVTAFAAENPTTTDKGATITVTGSYDPNDYERVISVDVKWGSMVFTYREGAMWDPSTHTNKQEGGWISEGNDITVTNHSNADILARFEFESNVEGFGGSFYTAETNGEQTVTATIPTAVGTLPVNAPKATVWFRAEEGKLSSDVASLGTLTVTLFDTLTAIDAREMDAAQLQAAVTAALANKPTTLHITMPEGADTAMLDAINTAVGETSVSLILYGMNKTEYEWNSGISSVKFICDSHDMNKETGNGTSHTLTCANCDYSTTESCTLTHTLNGNGTHTSSCDCGYYTTVDCDLDNVVYTWAYDNSACTASATCTVCKAEITETVTAAYNSEGVLVADFENTLFETQTITHEHTWDGKTCTVCGKTKVTLELTANGKGTTLILTVPENVYEPSIAEAMEQVKNLTQIQHILVEGNVTDAQYTTIKDARNGRAVYFENLTTSNYIAKNGEVFTCEIASKSDNGYVLVSDKQYTHYDYDNMSDAQWVQHIDGGTGARLMDKRETAWDWYYTNRVEQFMNPDSTLNENQKYKYWLYTEASEVKALYFSVWDNENEVLYGYSPVSGTLSNHWYPVFDIPLSAAE